MGLGVGLRLGSRPGLGLGLGSGSGSGIGFGFGLGSGLGLGLGLGSRVRVLLEAAHLRAVVAQRRRVASPLRPPRAAREGSGRRGLGTQRVVRLVRARARVSRVRGAAGRAPARPRGARASEIDPYLVRVRVRARVKGSLT